MENNVLLAFLPTLAKGAISILKKLWNYLIKKRRSVNEYNTYITFNNSIIINQRSGEILRLNSRGGRK